MGPGLKLHSLLVEMERLKEKVMAEFLASKTGRLPCPREIRSFLLSV